MPLPHNALILVADGRKMLFFRNHGDENQIDLRTEAHDARKDRKDREIRTDAPGTVQQSSGYGHSTYEEPDFHQQEEDRWIKDAADELKKRVLRNDFEALAIVAPPKALGVLKKSLHKEVEKRIVCTVNKEMSGRPVPDIEALLVGRDPGRYSGGIRGRLAAHLHRSAIRPARSPSSPTSCGPGRSGEIVDVRTVPRSRTNPQYKCRRPAPR